MTEPIIDALPHFTKIRWLKLTLSGPFRSCRARTLLTIRSSVGCIIAGLCGKADHLAKKIRVGALFQKALKAHHSYTTTWDTTSSDYLAVKARIFEMRRVKPPNLRACGYPR